ncbi:MAG: hypothetical protein ABSA78_08515 [Candidatus Sulfotelmatobacter sp.]
MRSSTRELAHLCGTTTEAALPFVVLSPAPEVRMKAGGVSRLALIPSSVAIEAELELVPPPSPGEIILDLGIGL